MSSYYGYNQSVWFYVNISVTAAVTVPIGVLGLLTCFKGRKRADTARTGFVWLKGAFALYFLAFIFTIVNSAAQAVFHNTVSSLTPSRAEEWDRIAYATSAVSNFFSWFADMALLISFIEIGNGFHYALTQTRTNKHKIMRNAAFALMIPLVIMTFVNTGYGGALWSEYARSYRNSATISKLMDLNYVYAAMSILHFIYSILAIAHASVVRNKYRGIEPSGKTVTLYLVATVLNAFPRSLWGVIYSCLIAFSETYFFLEVDILTRIILTHLVILVILTLLYVVSTRKQAGLWTTLQPWMNGVPPTLVHRNQLYYGVGPSGQPAYYQYAAPGQTPSGYDQSQTQYYGWQPSPQYQQQWAQQPQEVPGIPPNVVPAGDYAHMLPANGPELRYEGQVHHEMKA